MTDRPADLCAPDGRTLFLAEELADREGFGRLDPRFAVALIELRLAYGRPMIVSSCCRSVAYNGAVGGHRRSLHIWDKPAHPGLQGTAAIDIDVTSPGSMFALTRTAIELGWSVGVASWGLHLDRRDLASLPQGMFGYGG